MKIINTFKNFLRKFSELLEELLAINTDELNYKTKIDGYKIKRLK